MQVVLMPQILILHKSSSNQENRFIILKNAAVLQGNLPAKTIKLACNNFLYVVWRNI